MRTSIVILLEIRADDVDMIQILCRFLTLDCIGVAMGAGPSCFGWLVWFVQNDWEIWGDRYIAWSLRIGECEKNPLTTLYGHVSVFCAPECRRAPPIMKPCLRHCWIANWPFCANSALTVSSYASLNYCWCNIVQNIWLFWSYAIIMLCRSVGSIWWSEPSPLIIRNITAKEFDWFLRRWPMWMLFIPRIDQLEICWDAICVCVH